MLRKAAILVMLLILIGVGVSAYAEENAGTKLGRGIVNFFTSPIEVPKQMYLLTKQDNLLSGLTYGFVKGLCYGVMRAGSGAYDVVTFPIPKYEKLLMEPKFVFEGWE